VEVTPQNQQNINVSITFDTPQIMALHNGDEAWRTGELFYTLVPIFNLLSLLKGNIMGLQRSVCVCGGGGPSTFQNNF
jgi:hypothetical protein